MTCDQIDELLSDLIDDELADGVRAGVEAHLTSCEGCAASYRALKRTVRFVRANSAPALRQNSAGGNYADFVRAITTAPGDDTNGIIARELRVINGKEE